jgi:hypothetical protein
MSVVKKVIGQENIPRSLMGRLSASESNLVVFDAFVTIDKFIEELETMFSTPTTIKGVLVCKVISLDFE